MEGATLCQTVLSRARHLAPHLSQVLERTRVWVPLLELAHAVCAASVRLCSQPAGRPMRMRLNQSCNMACSRRKALACAVKARATSARTKTMYPTSLPRSELIVVLVFTVFLCQMRKKMNRINE